MEFLPSSTKIQLGKSPSTLLEHRIPIAQVATFQTDDITIFSQRIRLKNFNLQFHIIDAKKDTIITPFTKDDLLTVHYMLRGDIDAYLKDAGLMPLQRGEYNMFWVPGNKFHEAKVLAGQYWSFHIDLQPHSIPWLSRDLAFFSKILSSMQQTGGTINSVPYQIESFEKVVILKILSYKETGGDARKYLDNLVNNLFFTFLDKYLIPIIRQLADGRISDSDLANIFALIGHMEVNIGQSHNLQGIASKFHLSMDTLDSSFEFLLGTPAEKYYHNKRMMRAFVLLGTSNMSIEGIAIHLGYKDHELFEKDFFQYFSKTCSEIQVEVE
ncbi:Helix-turn-helix domain-containing protein [Chitinophaga sp. YR573]|uniref:helix-turn-helix transcriptional regulator n=1 Tax=Chitinophaga sp. YR573 TaxID=1881040 RepID=UPI0008AE4EF7|nr:helix-turn-helix domain-containing protein [Chitinophaga sp. YR573]SEW21315.1 Helix-turn-helix domain-containing protein [Chitinophaga sp. YR573]